MSAADPSSGARLSRNGAGAFPVIVVLLILALLLPWTVMIPSVLNATLAYLGLFAVAISIGLSVSDGFKPMLGFSSTFLLCWMFIPAIYQLSHHAAAWNDAQVLDSGPNVTSALALNLVTQTALLVGYLVSARRNTARDAMQHATVTSVDAQPEEHANIRSRLWVAGLFVAVSLALLPFAAQKLGGYSVFFAPRDLRGLNADQSLDIAANGGVMATIVNFFPFTFSVMGALLLLQALHMRGWRRFPFLGYVLLTAGCVLTWVYANPIANTRFIALSMLGSIAIVWLWPRTSRWGYVLLSAFVALTLLVYPIASLFNNSRGLSDSNAAVSQGPFAALATVDFDGFQQSINSFEYVAAHGHTWGHYLISALLVFIPRSIWSWKATPASIDVAGNHGYTFTNLSLPTNAELFIDFGWLGVVVIFLIVGWTFSRLDNLWGQPKWLSLVGFLALAQIGLIRGPLGSSVPVMIFTILGLLLCLRLFSERELNDRTKIS